MRIVVLAPVLFVLMGISNGFWGVQFADRPLLAIGSAALMAVFAIVVYSAFVRFIERRPVSELARAPLARELSLGLLGGAGLYTLCVLILMVLGVYRVDGVNPVILVLPSIAMAISSGVFEELLHRGVIFRNVEEVAGSWIELQVSALIFGLRHLGNPDASLLGALAITVEAGILLAALYLLTRRLWLGIGFHMGWNFVQSGIYSGSVSGAFEQPGLIKASLEGSELLTGGKFGMEASVVAFGFCTALGLVLLRMAARRGNTLPSWKRNRP
ncbi:MAG: CPBP family intramembrane metalloprotease [Rhizobiales bacterium]|nr:CPBP family intramembrane metalloprotease [Hyphomicrobiales bacterium]